jgi:hypothetical protein
VTFRISSTAQVEIVELDELAEFRRVPDEENTK